MWLLQVARNVWYSGIANKYRRMLQMHSYITKVIYQYICGYLSDIVILVHWYEQDKMFC